MIIGSNILFFKSLPSTNTYLVELLKKNHPSEGTIVYTDFQEAGRGYYGNSWESENGKNLLFSFVLYPGFIEPIDQFNISMAVSLGICDFLERYIPECSIKWPNDIYVNNDKIAGILIESCLSGDKIEYTVAGIGLNINQEKFSERLPNPVSLHILSGENYDLRNIIKEIAADLDKRYKQLIIGSSDQIRKAYILKLYRLNEWVKFSDSEGLFTGRIINVSDNGRLIIERIDSKPGEYSFKEIEFIF